MSSVKVAVVLERKHPDLAAFVVVPAAKWCAGSSVDGLPLGRRSLHRWDDDRWFIELRREHLAKLGKVPGERATLVIALASTSLPAELQQLLETVPGARARWEALTTAQQRMLREEILAGKASATRERRARAALLPRRIPRATPVKGLTSVPREIVVRIIGRQLPGRTWGPYVDVTVGLARKVGCDPADGVPADRRQAIWETRVDVRARDGAAGFRGPAVNGPPHQRFLYLTWIGRQGRAAPAMFRRAKLRLDTVPAAVLAAALHSGVLVGRLGLTAADGTPVCASVLPPAISWSSAGRATAKARRDRLPG